MNWLRETGFLCFLASVEFVLMTLMEQFYFERLSGGLPSLDVRVLGFSREEGMEWLTALGPGGSETILVWHYLTFDLVFPALLSAALASLILRFGNRLPRFAALSDTGKLALLGAAVLPCMLTDYAQNIAVARLLSDPLNADPFSLSLASGLIVTKFALFAIPLLVIAVFLLAGQKRS